MVQEKQMSADAAACFSLHSLHLILTNPAHSRSTACLRRRFVRLWLVKNKCLLTQPLVFPCAHYILYSRIPRIRAPLPAYAGDSFVNGPKKQMPPLVSLVFLLDSLYHFSQMIQMCHSLPHCKPLLSRWELVPGKTSHGPG